MPGGGLEPPTRGFSVRSPEGAPYILCPYRPYTTIYCVCSPSGGSVSSGIPARLAIIWLSNPAPPSDGMGPAGRGPQGLDARFGPRRGPGTKSGPRRAESPHKPPLNGRPACRRRGLRTPRDGSRIPRTPTLPEKFSGPPGAQKCCPVVGRRGAAGVGVDVNK